MSVNQLSREDRQHRSYVDSPTRLKQTAQEVVDYQIIALLAQISAKLDNILVAITGEPDSFLDQNGNKLLDQNGNFLVPEV